MFAQLKAHLRNKFIAGILAAIPVAVTIFIVWYADSTVRSVSGVKQPFLGVAIALAAIYGLGLFVTSFAGRFVLRSVDAVLLHAPGLRDLYRAWKQVALTEGEGGVFANVVLLPDESNGLWMLGFTTNKAIEGDAETLCVFVPASPNPTSGRIFFAPRRRCVPVDMSPKEAFKLILSGGNYVPAAVGKATAIEGSRSPQAPPAAR